MPTNSEQKTRNGASLGSLAKSVGLLRSEMKINNQEAQAGLTQIREEIRTGFDQMYRHVDGFMKLHETLDIGFFRV